MTQPKKLIEVAMPIREVSAESVRDKSIRHGHISTLHLWWARRPLPVCRAVVFASLVPDPLDEHCPKAFRDAVELLLGKKTNPGDPYQPYKNIPGTSALDPMDDNLRNRLLMFIGKFSPKYQENEEAGKSKTDGKELLSPFSLIKWESRNDPKIIGKARQLIWVAHNCKEGKGNKAEGLIAEHDALFTAITKAEDALYGTPDRHIPGTKVQKLEAQLHAAIEAYLERMPKVFDPFAGGGAIPLEAARLGCRSYGNDLNPVAHIIQRGSLEFPQKYGKPITYSKAEYVKRYGARNWDERPQEQKIVVRGEATAILLPNRLLHDVEHYARLIASKVEAKVSSLYSKDGKGKKPIAYYWVRTATCTNPACRAEIPLLKQFYLSKRRSALEKDYVHLRPIIKDRKISFDIVSGPSTTEGWLKKGAILVCPCCESLTELKELKKQFTDHTTGERMLAVIYEGDKGKQYVQPSAQDLARAKVQLSFEPPSESMDTGNYRDLKLPKWGLFQWQEVFSRRQLTVIQSMVDEVNACAESFDHADDYSKAVLTYMGILVDRMAARNTAFGVWHILQETVEHPFGRQAIPMVFDYPEMDPFGTLSGSVWGQLDSILNYIEQESTGFPSTCVNASSGEREQFPTKSISAVVTDPPYYDAIAYADLSDFFYIWLKRTVGELYPLNFATPLTPKTEECTALKHQHDENVVAAREHFEKKLLQIFLAIEHQTSDIVSIMFAHQSTAAWTTLCNSVLGAGMNITGSWAVDTEVTGALKADMATLASSVTVSARPAQRQGIGNFKEVRSAIEDRVSEEVELLYKLGFRGADLLTACFGQAVSEFGKYKRVEKADGSEVSVAELLELARESAFNALLKGFAGDDYTKFSIGWLQLYGYTQAEFDDAAKFSRVGLTLDVQDLIAKHLFISKGNKLTLANSAERVAADANLGKRKDSPLIDGVHRAMQAYKGGNRANLLKAISECGPDSDHPFWRVLTSLAEVLPPDSEDRKLTKELLAIKDNVLHDARQVGQSSTTQTQMGFEA